MTEVETFVIVGGGQAGGRAAEAMRAAGFDGRIVILAGEPVRPYERPPLSKQVLTGESDAETVFLRDESCYDSQDIEVRVGTEVSAIDREARRLALASGESLTYDKLLLATGTRVRHLPVPGEALGGVHYLRTLADSDALRPDLAPGRRIVTVGGGYIGLEVAAAARKRDCTVTVLEASDRLMGRQIAPELGAWFAEQHRARGVDVRTGVQVEGFVDDGTGRVSAVQTADGGEIAADAVVVGVGVRPNVELAEAAGLSCDDGIVVDEQGRTADPAIFAAGDVSRHPNPVLGRAIRLESWQNAQLQAEAAGRTMAGCPSDYRAVPWFWSDQFDINLQMVGLPESWDRLVWRGDPARDAAFSVFYLSGGRVVAANAVNQGKDIAPARKMIETAARPDPAALADTGVTLKKVLKAAG